MGLDVICKRGREQKDTALALVESICGSRQSNDLLVIHVSLVQFRKINVISPCSAGVTKHLQALHQKVAIAHSGAKTCRYVIKRVIH